jgi:hypothetical protein
MGGAAPYSAAVASPTKKSTRCPVSLERQDGWSEMSRRSPQRTVGRGDEDTCNNCKALDRLSRKECCIEGIRAGAGAMYSIERAGGTRQV